MSDVSFHSVVSFSPKNIPKKNKTRRSAIFSFLSLINSRLYYQNITIHSVIHLVGP